MDIMITKTTIFFNVFLSANASTLKKKIVNKLFTVVKISSSASMTKISKAHNPKFQIINMGSFKKKLQEK